MTRPRHLVHQTLDFDKPHRVPRQLWMLPWAERQYPDQVSKIKARFPDDIVTAPGVYGMPINTSGNQYEIGTYVDEWGCSFENIQYGVIGEVKQPLVRTWDDLDKVVSPLAALSLDVDQVNAFCRSTDKFVIGGCCPRPFERMQFLRRSDNLYIDLAEQPSEFFTLLNRVHEFYLKEMDTWALTKVDALMFMDDWGAQRSLLISPRQWREIFAPLYRDYIALAHAHNKKVFMHSDGYTADIIPILIEMGLDAINCQLFTMDIEALGTQYAGKITFWGEIDRQHILPSGTLQDVDQAVRRVKNSLYRDGGCIAQCEFGPGGKPENVYQVYQTWEDIFKQEKAHLN